ncbi:hypothetical protein AURDEDRAFT_119097 [Auricularia subglabra TFB-10046 SS5]|nr:hypothetical protein AURDEDRAFT_119097 [Auricularia subglabra TFB-10046 SS5]
MASPYKKYGQHLTAQHVHLATPPPQHIPLPPSRATSAMSGRSASFSPQPHPQTPPRRSASGTYPYQASPLGDARSTRQGSRSAMGGYDSRVGSPSTPARSVYSQAATASTYGSPRYHQYPAPPVPPLNIHHRNSPPLPNAGPPLLAPTPKYPRTSPRVPSLLSRYCEDPPSSDSESESESEREEIRSPMARSTASFRRPRASSPTPTSRTALSHRSGASAKTHATVSTVKRVQSTPSLVGGGLYWVPDGIAPPVPSLPVMTPASSYSGFSSGYTTPVSAYSAGTTMTSSPAYAATPNQFAHPPFPGYTPPPVPQAYPVAHPGSGIPPRKRTITSTATFVDDGRGGMTKVSEFINYDPKKKGIFDKLFK